MKSSPLMAVVTFLLMVMVADGVHAYPIVTMPTAGLVEKGYINFAYCAIDTKTTVPFAPDSISVGAAYIGITPRFELDLTYQKPNAMDGITSIGLEYLLVGEHQGRPAVALGAEDVTRAMGTTSLYVALAKTVTPTPGGVPKYPLVRLDLGYGTAPRSAFFGGAEISITPAVCIALLYDGHDESYSLTCFVPKTPLALQAGTLGRATWIGVQAYLPLK